MIYYDYYGAPDDVIDAFVQTIEMGRLVTTTPDGGAHIGVYPFHYRDGVVEMHLHREDEQLADLTANERCLFEVDEILGVIPSYWVHPEHAGMGTAYHRTVIFECTASFTDDPGVLAAQQAEILTRYQPEGGYRPVTVDEPMYQPMLGMITALQLQVVACRAKFKIGQNRSPQQRATIIEHLRERGRHDDGRAADALQWTIDQGLPATHTR